MNIFDLLVKKKQTIIPKEIMTTPSINSPISEPILNHLKMRTTGALLLTGDWGSGKTYHIKKCIFPLIESSTEYTPIIVSLFGEKEKSNIANKVLFAYFDSKGKNVNLGTGTIAKNLKNISDAVPYLKNFVDVEKLLLGTGENAFRWIPQDKLFICFDDVERMSSELNIDDFLGLVNDLVENRGCKILLIANESKIGKGISFKEKTIEKTIHFLPDLEDIFDSIVDEYDSSVFKTYLLNNKDFFIKTITTNTEDENLNKELNESFSNIRTLKFALEHFRFPFYLLITKEDIEETLDIQLKNIWIFTLAISIEFKKPNNISFGKRKNLDILPPTISELYLSGEAFHDSSKEKIEKENEWSYSENFKMRYYNRLSESYIYFKELYDLITSGKEIARESFIQNVQHSFNIKEGKINPAHQILNSFLYTGYYSYTNEGFVKALQKLLAYCEQGELEDIVSYLNAGVYIIGFNELISLEKKLIVDKIKTGLDIFIPKTSVNYTFKTQFGMVQSSFEEPNIKLLIEYIKQSLSSIEAKNSEEEANKMEWLLQNDLSSFVKEFLPERYDIRTPDKSLFHKFKPEIVQICLNNALPKGIMDLTSLLKIRYLDMAFSERLTDEILFLDNLEIGISKIDFSVKSLSSYLIEGELLPSIMKCKDRLQLEIKRAKEI